MPGTSFKIILALLSVLFTANSIAQVKLSSFQNIIHLDTELPQHTVQALAQDAKGYIWIGTEGGICRYDGKYIKTFTNSKNSPVEFNSNIINSFQTDQQDRIWVATSEGVNMFWPEKSYEDNLRNKQFIAKIKSVVKEDVAHSINRMGNGNLLLTYHGALAEVNPLTEKINYIPLITVNGLKIKPIVLKYLELSTGETMLLLQKEGLVKGSFKKGFVLLSPTSELEKLDIKEYYDVVIISPSKFALATNKGVYFSNYYGQLQALKITGGLDKKIEKEACFTLKYDKQQNVILAGTGTLGLILLDTNGIVYDHIFSNRLHKPLLSNSIYSILVDTKGLGYWIGTSHGLSRFFYNENKFRKRELLDTEGAPLVTYPIYTSDNKKLLIGTVTQLLSIDLITNTNHRLKISGSYDKFRFYCFTKMDSSRILMGTDKGLFITSNNNFSKNYPAASLYTELKFTEDDRIYFIYPLNKDRFLLAYRNDTAAGLIDWNILKHTATISRPDKNNSFSNENIINSIIKTPDGQIITCSKNGMQLFNESTGQFTPLFSKQKKILNHPQVNTAFIEGDIYWIATYGGGLNKYDSKTKKVVYYQEKDGLSNNDIYSIVPTNDSILWMSTNRGICLFNKVNGKSINFYRQQGLLDNEFDRNSSFILGDTIYFGGLSGFVCFNHKKMGFSGIEPSVYISEIRLLQKNKDQIIYSDQNNSVAVSQNSNTLQLRLSCPFFISPTGTKFYYRLLPENYDWISTGDINEVLLIGLRKGQHTLEVKAQTSEGRWSNNIATLVIYVKPKWYQTLLFKIVLALLLILIGTGIYKLRQMQEIKEKAVRKQIASDLHDDLGGTLNSIKLYSHLAAADNNPEHLLNIRNNTSEAVTGLKDLIWTLDDHKDTVEDLAKKIESFAHPAFVSAIKNFECYCPSNCQQLLLRKEEKRNLYLILKEAVTNTLKHAPNSGINIYFYRRHDKLQITYKDDCGFRFNTNAHGNGLKNMQERADAIHYSFSFLWEEDLIKGFVMIKK